LLFTQLNPTESFEEIIIHTLQRRKKVENCIVVFLDCICDHCNSIGFN